MRRLLATLLLVVLYAQHIRAQIPEPVSDPNLVLVRIKSHGASGSVIMTSPTKSWVLSCAHMFFDKFDRVDQRLTTKKIVIDGPKQPYAHKMDLVSYRVLGIDQARDLSLIEIDNGPFNYMPIAQKGFRPGRNLRSAGFDKMEWPVMSLNTSIVSFEGRHTYTRERPIPGRSGGGLFDIDSRVLIGVVQGFEVTGQQRGIYISHEAILNFMAGIRTAEAPKYQPINQQCPT